MPRVMHGLVNGMTLAVVRIVEIMRYFWLSIYRLLVDALSLIKLSFTMFDNRNPPISCSIASRVFMSFLLTDTIFLVFICNIWYFLIYTESRKHVNGIFREFLALELELSCVLRIVTDLNITLIPYKRSL